MLTAFEELWKEGKTSVLCQETHQCGKDITSSAYMLDRKLIYFFAI